MKTTLPLPVLALLVAGCMPAPPPEDPDRFVLLDADGQPAAAGQVHACVLDTATTLTWAVPRAGDDLLDPAHRYSWFSREREQHLGEPGLENGGTCGIESCDTAAVVDALNALGLCGHDDWRLPTHEEAIMLGKRHGDFALGVHPRLFPGVPGGEVWTSTTFRLYPQSAWAYNTGNALDRADLKTEAKGVRLVRGTLTLPRRR
jgi:hypothetical protein